MSFLKIIAMSLVLILLWGCSEDDIFQELAGNRELIVVTRNSPTTYYFDGDQASGFEYDLIKAYATARGYTLRVEVAFTLEEFTLQLDRGQVHLGAAGMAINSKRAGTLLATAPYLQQQPVVIYKSGKRRPRRLADLSRRDVIVLSGSSHIEVLENLKEQVPLLTWREVQTGDTLELMQLVTEEKAELAVLGAAEFRLQQQLYPRLVAALDLEVEESIGWYLPNIAGADVLQTDINLFLETAQQSGELEKIRERHFGTTRFSSRMGAFTFNRRVESVLPKWQPLIERVATEYQMDWRLLAAVSYQESHWNPTARSPTGVEGMMMLTRNTAKELNVADRRDPQQSLRGGARFIKNLLRRLPADIEQPHRLWMALAAYNIGLGHLEDARVIAEKRGLNPHIWSDVRSQLPKLQNPDVYPSTRFGFARGNEAVTYVDNIRQYYSTLQLMAVADERIQPPLNVAEMAGNNSALALPIAL
ncbi:membrane-bound lytic murein transglycosylase MltF [Luminiphilus sp. nBUS_16]|uniref:membrane-bound lytic murein transglycosylase MltF n=1 Tax=Luminiphilus sp. nBUS_16 TaxID=3395315 RepID=UPI003EBC8957